MPAAGTDTGAQRAQAARLYRLSLSLGGLGLLVVGLGLASAYRALHLGAEAGGTLSVDGQRFRYPQLNPAGAVVLVLAAIGVIVLALAARSALRQARVHRRLERSLVAWPLEDQASQEPGVWIVAEPAPRAFCTGLWRPRIYVTSGALGVLEPDELKAVVAHEACHRSRRDPLRFALAQALGDAAFFLPAVRRLGARYRALAELAADEAAVSACGGDRGPLARALLALAGPLQGAPDGSAGLSLAPERVDGLMGRSPRLPRLAPVVLVSLASALVMGGAALEAGRGAAIQTSLRLPLLSGQPCVLMLALLPVLLGAGAMLAFRRVARPPPEMDR
ncbi:MAG: hypothetical protein QOK40_4 [Miltoncostaeaceae bacterium]|nr:hypothetical protein [Miltoncostaeaceae bacterium]